MANGSALPPKAEAPAPAAAATAQMSKKSKKKALDSNEASKLVAARISQLELDAAGEKDQEIEIGTIVTPDVYLLLCFGGWRRYTPAG